MQAIHSSPYAGTWYPADAAELERLLDVLFERSSERTGACALANPLGFVVPHAGLVYSGAVAAGAYRMIAQDPPRRIVLLGFAHRGGPRAVAIPEVERIGTPLGEVAVDLAAAAKLAGHQPFQIVPERRVCDHSVEIQLPLLIKAAPGVPVLPLYVGALDEAARSEAARALAELAQSGSLLIASTDLTHYGQSFRYQPFPPGEDFDERMRELDERVIEAAGSLDAEIFLEHLAAGRSTVCGADPVALLLAALACLPDGEIYQETIDYQTSAEITGDTEHSVSYGALGYFRARSFELGSEDRELLLESARRTLRRMWETGARKPVPPARVTPALARKGGAFVTLYEGTSLAGCVGHRCAFQPLAEAVPELTLSAALDDPRFNPLRQARRPVGIEISVLTPHRRVRGPSQCVLGRHGVHLELGDRRALLLPQVAENREWTVPEFLSTLSLKAGLPPDAWSRPDARLSVFQAQVFRSDAAVPAIA